MKLRVHLNNDIEAAGILHYFPDYNYVGVNMYDAEFVIIDSDSASLMFYKTPSGNEKYDDTCTAIDGITGITNRLNAIKIGNTVVFDYDSDGRTRRVVVIKEVNASHIKGLDVLDDFKFKSFLRSRIEELKQVK